MEGPREVNWKAPEHHHFEKTVEWFLILAIISGALAFAAFYLGNFLLGVLIIIGALVMAIAGARKPRDILYAVNVRGIRVGHLFYAYKNLDTYSIDEEHRHGPHLLAVTQSRFAPMLVIPIPEELIDDIEDLLQTRLDEDDLEEPFFNILLEILRF